MSVKTVFVPCRALAGALGLFEVETLVVVERVLGAPARVSTRDSSSGPLRVVEVDGCVDGARVEPLAGENSHKWLYYWTEEEP